MFDLSFYKLIVLGVIALIIFGPDRLPAMAAQAGRALRELRRLADGARSELQDSLGPEFGEFDISDLNPRQFVRKHLMEEFSGSGFTKDGIVVGDSADAGNGATSPAQAAYSATREGEPPPFDAEAT